MIKVSATDLREKLYFLGTPCCFCSPRLAACMCVSMLRFDFLVQYKCSAFHQLSHLVPLDARSPKMSANLHACIYLHFLHVQCSRFRKLPRRIPNVKLTFVTAPGAAYPSSVLPWPSAGGLLRLPQLQAAQTGRRAADLYDHHKRRVAEAIQRDGLHQEARNRLSQPVQGEGHSGVLSFVFRTGGRVFR